ncbi:hypothetical protein [Ruegeria sp. HKCCD7303]|uniref:hypothetical protein n=1 Tax=Ruegeria sp. HKCCD7303 TaxID=2683013 RepID=UPI001A1007A0|nr:hypothetical protein [Ruegeria sp. HKCCD7303]NOD66247.1 hypothetical protein [Ruegeria sp. HKCCD7303]
MDWESVKPVSSFFLSWQRPDVVFANRESYKNSITEFRFFFLGTRFAGVQFSTLITAKGLLELGLDWPSRMAANRKSLLDRKIYRCGCKHFQYEQ